MKHHMHTHKFSNVLSLFKGDMEEDNGRQTE